MRTGWLIVGALTLGMGCSAGAGMDGRAPSMGTDAGAAAPSEDGGDLSPDPPPPVDLPDAPAPDPDPPPPEDAPMACDGRTGQTGSRLLTMTHDGLVRSTLLHVPDGYDATRGAMLVLNFHGFTSAGWQQALLTGMNERADERGFIVAYPQGVAVSWNAGDCCGTAWTDAVDDVGFVRALIDRIAEEYCVDPRRVYATGMSNGGFLSHRLACELSDRVAAIAPVAGVMGIDAGECAPARPVPVWAFHGTRDLLVPYEGGTPVVSELGTGIVFRSVDATLGHWAAHNGCRDERVTLYEEGDATCVAYAGCDAPTRLCTIAGGGHTWPGGLPIPFLGSTSRDLDATEAMLDFFEAHPMR